MAAIPRRFDLFCRVVDHFGDAGVALRLARQLAHEHEGDAVLWIDDLTSLARIAPGVDPRKRAQTHDGIDVRAIEDADGSGRSPEVVIEAFGCGLPEPYLDALENQAHAPVWLNLEYLSAEALVDSAHGLPSPPPRRALRRWFFFPGFTGRTGGLIRERDLFAARDRHRNDERASPPAGDSLTVSLFCYPNAALPALLETWADADDRIVCIVPEGIATAALDRFLSGAVPHAGEIRRCGALTLALEPFVDQRAFDRRLWTCDLDFVRGEDSFVRAQWAARPLVWHAYPQTEGAHLAKLAAFLDRYCAGLAADVATAMRRFWQAFNDGDGVATAEAWPTFRAVLPTLATRADHWAAEQAARPDLASQLVEFARERL